jgi:hypothetical protein
VTRRQRRLAGLEGRMIAAVLAQSLLILEAWEVDRASFFHLSYWNCALLQEVKSAAFPMRVPGPKK